MTQIELSSEITVKLIDSMASDLAVTRAAQVSVKGENNPDTDSARLINYLLSSRHGSPFEHATFTFFVEAPIFVFREWHRHRIASINEMSGRYSILPAKFYIPAEDRNLVNVGTSARPEFAPGTAGQVADVRVRLADIYQQAWDTYEFLIDSGVANEVSRLALPVAVYSQMYWTVNARALMNFLSLRTDARTHGIPDAEERGLAFSRPQREIEIGAEKLEAIFAQEMPHTYEAFVKNGRIAP